MCQTNRLKQCWIISNVANCKTSIIEQKMAKIFLRESITYIKVTQSPKVLLLSVRYQPDTVRVKVVSDRLMLKNMS